MPDDATERVVEHSARLQPSINLHAPITAFMFSFSGSLVTSYSRTQGMLSWHVIEAVASGLFSVVCGDDY